MMNLSKEHMVAIDVGTLAVTLILVILPSVAKDRTNS